MGQGSKKDIAWINTGRAICMLCVYIAHCNFYYMFYKTPVYFVYKPFYLSFFFFISGFLFFKNLEKFPFKHKGKNLINKLILPTLLFSTLIWIPKALVHGNDVSLRLFLYDIFGGTACWFASTLIIAQILSLLIFFFIRNIYGVFVVGIITLITSFYLVEIDPTPFPWYYKSGMIAVFFMALGGMFNKHYRKLKKYISIKNMLISGAAYFAIMLINYYYIGCTQHIMTVKYDNIPFGLFNNILGIIFIIQVSHYIPKMKWMQYIGKNTLIFYFMAGGVPLIMGLVARRFFPAGGYLVTFAETAVCVALIFPISYIINRYFPWMLDFSKIINKSKSTK